VTADPPRLPRGRRYLVRGLLALASLLAVLATFAIWANRQVLDADNWADTSSALLADDAIRGQVAAFSVDQVYSDVDVAGEVKGALPKRLKPLAGPAANGLRELAERRMNKVLERPRVQTLWKEANRVTAQQFINIAEKKSKAVTTSGDAVILDLRPIVIDFAKRLGLPGTKIAKIPADAARIKVMSSDQVTKVQDGVSLVRGLGTVLPLLAFILMAAAVWLARGRRRVTLLAAGLDLIAAGLLVLVLMRVAGSAVVDSLAKTEAVRPAADAVWSISTAMLRDIAQALIIVGIPVVAAAWLAGPRGPAVAFRRAVAPTMRDRPGIAYSVVAVLVLLILAWGPIPATRMPVPILVMIVLAALGTAALRRQTVEEFPEATAGSASARARERASAALRAMQERRARPGVAASVAADPGGRLDSLERLSRLHDQGVLTDEEFAAEKAGLINGGQPAGP
jgi:Short C-terminal domain